MTRTLRAGLIGLGVMGRNHARILSTLEGVELVGVADAAEARQGLPAGVPIVTDAAELIDMDIDYAVVAAPTDQHRQLANALARAGVSALIEKPLAPTPAEADAISAEFERAGLVAGVGHIERYNPALREARRRLEAGDLGEVYQLVTRRQSPFPGRISDVGVTMDLATHDIDITRWLMDSEFVSVTARTAHKSGRRHEDLVAWIAGLASGVTTSHLVNWLTPVKERSVVVTGEAGTISVDLLTADITKYENGTVAAQWPEMARFRGVSEGNIVRFAIAKPEPLRTEHEAFRDAVLGRGNDIVTLGDGAAAVRVAAALVLSASTSSSVALTESESRPT